MRFLVEIDEHIKLWRIEELTFFEDVVSKRVLSAFSSIDEEATKHAETIHNDLLEAVSDQAFIDISGLADQAFEEGLELYENLHRARNEIIGTLCSSIYHIWERSTKELFHRQLSRWTFVDFSANEIHKYDFAKLIKLIVCLGWDIEKEEFYLKLKELQLASNALKHGEGNSMEKLYSTFPHMFMEIGGLRLKGHSCIMLDDQIFHSYVECLKQFWQRMPSQLYSIPPKHQEGLTTGAAC